MGTAVFFGGFFGVLVAIGVSDTPLGYGYLIAAGIVVSLVWIVYDSLFVSGKGKQ